MIIILFFLFSNDRIKKIYILRKINCFSSRKCLDQKISDDTFFFKDCITDLDVIAKIIIFNVDYGKE